MSNRRGWFSPSERGRLKSLLQGVRDRNEVLRMREYTQHGSITTYDHCERVAKASFWLSRRLRLRSDEASLVRGAMLHDFYLYDWHAKDNGEHRLHGFTHPGRAAENARKHFAINAREENIIRSHMWPLTFRSFPSCREAVIVCIADKVCSLHETLFCR